MIELNSLSVDATRLGVNDGGVFTGQAGAELVVVVVVVVGLVVVVLVVDAIVVVLLVTVDVVAAELVLVVAVAGLLVVLASLVEGQALCELFDQHGGEGLATGAMSEAPNPTTNNAAAASGFLARRISCPNRSTLVRSTSPVWGRQG